MKSICGERSSHCVGSAVDRLADSVDLLAAWPAAGPRAQSGPAKDHRQHRQRATWPGLAWPGNRDVAQRPISTAGAMFDEDSKMPPFSLLQIQTCQWHAAGARVIQASRVALLWLGAVECCKREQCSPPAMMTGTGEGDGDEALELELGSQWFVDQETQTLSYS
jgi:hypothetical protein